MKVTEIGYLCFLFRYNLEYVKKSCNIIFGSYLIFLNN